MLVESEPCVNEVWRNPELIVLPRARAINNLALGTFRQVPLGIRSRELERQCSNEPVLDSSQFKSLETGLQTPDLLTPSAAVLADLGRRSNEVVDAKRFSRNAAGLSRQNRCYLNRILTPCERNPPDVMDKRDVRARRRHQYFTRKSARRRWLVNHWSVGSRDPERSSTSMRGQVRQRDRTLM